jgi:hypothetical protein
MGRKRDSENGMIVTGREVAWAIKENKLSTAEKYERYRLAHPETQLPRAAVVVALCSRTGRDWVVLADPTTLCIRATWDWEVLVAPTPQERIQEFFAEDR